MSLEKTQMETTMSYHFTSTSRIKSILTSRLLLPSKAIGIENGFISLYKTTKNIKVMEQIYETTQWVSNNAGKWSLKEGKQARWDLQLPGQLGSVPTAARRRTQWELHPSWSKGDRVGCLGIQVGWSSQDRAPERRELHGQHSRDLQNAPSSHPWVLINTCSTNHSGKTLLLHKLS